MVNGQGLLGRSRFLRENWGRRLAASFGAKESFRTENWLCLARVVLALYCYAWIQMSASGVWPLRVKFRRQYR
jgi:hypothetical protein